jgi:hypothetical protein
MRRARRLPELTKRSPSGAPMASIDASHRDHLPGRSAVTPSLTSPHAAAVARAVTSERGNRQNISSILAAYEAGIIPTPLWAQAARAPQAVQPTNPEVRSTSRDRPRQATPAAAAQLPPPRHLHATSETAQIDTAETELRCLSVDCSHLLAKLCPIHCPGSGGYPLPYRVPYGGTRPFARTRGTPS